VIAPTKAQDDQKNGDLHACHLAFTIGHEDYENSAFQLKDMTGVCRHSAVTWKWLRTTVSKKRGWEKKRSVNNVLGFND
jgi:hypothetical protein